ncbi:hypothetical protein AS026_28375 [Rhizobium altiplani]|uniref:Uncharacterized protein n=1 Tax=Rhizobium altiplani TaxID=1864509 RepID=A0A109K2M3_9HYPH|nr:hypothetical protein [Rhizobium altiplani]KWV59568.1 hypothetical protein AS026_28375 [Rhizobium altiplani]
MRENINIISRFVAFVSTAVLIVLIFYLKFKPLHFNPIGGNLDESWQAALAYAAEKGLRFGTDIAFTGGPLSGIYTRSFQNGAPFQLAIYSLAVPIYIGVSLTHLLQKNIAPLTARVLIVALIGICPFVQKDIFLLSIPFFAAMSGVSGTGGANRAISVSGAVLAGIVSLSKFSVFPLAILCLFAADLSDLKQRRLPLHLAAMGLAFCVAFIGSGQDKSQIIPFILSSLEVSSGYSSAMSIPGRSRELAAYLGASLAFIALLFYVTLNDGRWRDVTRKLLISLIFFAFLFIGFKAGFVRHDLHSIIAWNVLTVAVLTCAATMCGRRLSFVAILLAIASIIPPYILLSNEAGRSLLTDTGALVRDANEEFSLLKIFTVAPEQWLADLQNTQTSAKARLGENSGLQKYQGTIDVVPSNQSLAIAAGSNYHPRPTIQEYTTYNSKLIARNRAFFQGEQAPDYLVFAPGSIDGRHPASAEGSLWPLFFSRYEPVDEQPQGLVLAKRTTPITNLEAETVSVEASIDREVEVPKDDAPLMMAVHVQPRLLGKIMDILYRPPGTQLTVKYDDGAIISYRLIPEMADAGFLLSPLVNTTSDYVLVSTGRTGYPALRRARSVKITMGGGHQLAYDDKIRIDFTRLDAAKLTASNKNAFIDSAIRKADSLTPLLRENVLKEPSFITIPEGVLAHAPMSLHLQVAGASKVSLAFGLRTGAWQNGGASDGACFLVKAGDQVMMNRCLNPKDVEADRPEQTVTLDIPKGVSNLTLETACGVSCGWDWAYWGGVYIE